MVFYFLLEKGDNYGLLGLLSFVFIVEKDLINSYVLVVNYYFGCEYMVRVRVMVLNTYFNNISVILWRSVLLMEETAVSGVNHRPAVGH